MAEEGGFSRVYIEGREKVEHAFRKVEREVQREMGATLKAAAEPIRSTAEQLATARIAHIGSRWNRMRLGVARGGEVVYIAPKSKGHGSRRPNLAPLLKDQAMIPALDGRREEVIASLELMVRATHKRAGF